MKIYVLDFHTFDKIKFKVSEKEGLNKNHVKELELGYFDFPLDFNQSGEIFRGRGFAPSLKM